MIDEHDVREMLRRRANAVPTAEVDAPKAARRGRRRLLANGALAVLATAGIALATFAGIEAVRTAPIPGDDPSQELGIFAPVAGRIVYVNEAEVGDPSYAVGLWAIDPNGPADTAEGPGVADDVVSTLVPLGLEEAEPLGWSGDGTKLLLMRTDGDQLFPEQYLSILHADGSETPLNQDPMYFGGAAISPDGTRVVFAVQAVDADELGLYVVDADGGRPTRLPIPRAEGIVVDPTFSPDGTRIAYVDSGESENHVWVMDADGGNAQELLADEPALVGGAGNLRWSPAGDRLAIQVRVSNGDNVISTFAPDGSDFTQIVTGGLSPFWSPDGSRIAYTIECDISDTSCGGLVIVDADGSNVREFGYADSGPWHPGASATDEPVPTPVQTPTPVPSDGTVQRVDGEVLSFTGVPFETRGDLVAVNPETGEERVLVEDLDTVFSARWSADGRWVAYETPAEDGNWELWVAGASQEPRLVARGGPPDIFASLGLYWIWSPTGAELATIARSRLSTIDLATGETTDLGKIVADLLESNASPTWAWSPDGTRLVFAAPEGAPEGSLDTVGVRSGERSLLARLPDEDWDLTEGVLWSPDGAHIAVLIRKASDEAGRLYVMDADGSNIRVVADDYDPLGIAWSPDGTQIAFGEGSEADGDVRIRVATMDDAAPAEIGTVPFTGCTYNYECGLTWSPDGSQIAFWKFEGGRVTAFHADGAGETAPIDELTYTSWAGGGYSCQCT